MTHILRTFAAAAATLAVTLSPLPVDAQGRHGGWHARGGYGHGHGHWGSGWLWGGLGLGIGLWPAPHFEPNYAPTYAPNHGAYSGYQGYGPVQPPVVRYDEWPTPAPLTPGLPIPAPHPDPVVYPRNGQSAELTEAGRQACNRWAATQPSAMQDGSVFQRATEACMDGRGYTLR